MPPTAYQQPRFVTWPVRNPRCLSKIFYFRAICTQPGTSGQIAHLRGHGPTRHALTRRSPSSYVVP